MMMLMTVVMLYITISLIMTILKSLFWDSLQVMILDIAEILEGDQNNLVVEQVCDDKVL